MNRNSVVICIITVLAVCALFAQPASAARETHVSYNPVTQTVDYSITGGDPVTYTIHVLPSGCVDTTSSPVDLQGPNDSNHVSISCVTSSSSGQIAVQFCEGVICFDQKTINFKCLDDCTIVAMPRVPATSIWGLIILSSLLILTAVVVIRRRRVTVK